MATEEQITCAHCGVEFPWARTRGQRPRFCDPKCRNRSNYERQLADGRVAETREKQKQREALLREARPKKPCPYCAAPMANPRRKQCGALACKRRYNADRMRDYQRIRYQQEPEFRERKNKKFECVCIQCGKPWRARKESAKFCSFTCQAAHQHGDGRKRRLSPAQKRRAAARRRLARAARGSSGRTPWVTGWCSECGAGFATPLPLARTCSATCAQVRRRKRHGKYVDDDTRLAIYERDGWTCQLCFEPVDPTLHYLDDWAASLDHIVCRSWSEEPDHSPENLRLAHRWCNSVRGDESHYGTAMLAAA